MSKKSKALAKTKRLFKKRAIKLANKAKYQTWKEQGQNTKSIRARKNNKRKLVSTESHPNGACGNIGCKRCNPILL